MFDPRNSTALRVRSHCQLQFLKILKLRFKSTHSLSLSLTKKKTKEIGRRELTVDCNVSPKIKGDVRRILNDKEGGPPSSWEPEEWIEREREGGEIKSRSVQRRQA